MFTVEDIYQAYRKFKSNVYYDNTSLFLRKKIAEFETGIINKDCISDITVFKNNFSKRVERLLNILNSPNDEFPFSIDVKYHPKKIKPTPSKKNNSNFITNQLPTGENIEIEQYNLMVDADIEVHIISVLWIMHIGKLLKDRIDSHNYAYNLMLDDVATESSYNENYTNEGNGLRLFEPYYKGYQRWRDRSLECALDLLDQSKNATILSLDITKYFYSVQIDLDEITKNIESDKKQVLNNLLTKIHIEYTNKAKANIANYNKTRIILPIGLLSSGLIANRYLSEFDERVIKILNPAYYGRYVDDMLFVFSDRIINVNDDDIIKSFISDIFEQKEILRRLEFNL